MLGTEYKSLDKILDLIYNYVTFLNTTMTVTTEDAEDRTCMPKNHR